MCDNPRLVARAGDISKSGKPWKTDIEVPCSRCPKCKQRRVQDWVFRLQEEDKISSSSFFVTLTYNTQNVPINDRGQMTLDKTHFQKFMKRLRKCQKSKIKYYMAGEYGEQRQRPHYHMIIFNLEDIEHLTKSWTHGSIDIGTCTKSSIAYTAMYIDKKARIPMFLGDERQKEFSLMSKGMGKSYLTENMVKYHREDPTRLYLTTLGGYKKALPRYYRNKIWNESEREKQIELIKQIKQEQDEQEQKYYEQTNETPYDYEQNKALNKIGAYQRFYRRTENKIRD